MRIRGLRLLFWAAILFLGTPAIAAGGSPAALVRAALDTIGGEQVIREGSVGIQLDGSYDLGTALQGRVNSISEPTPLLERIHLVYPSGRSGYERRGHNYTHSVQHLREVRKGGAATGYIDLLSHSGGWPPFSAPADSHLRHARILPQVMLVDALDRKSSLRSAGAQGDVQLLQYRTSAGDGIRIAIGADLLPLWAESEIDHPLLGEVAIRWHWQDYRPQDGILVPARATTFLGGQPLKQISLSFGIGAFADLLEVPSNIEMGPRPEELRDFVPYGERRVQTETIAPGVHVVRSLRPGFNVMFVEYDDHVVAIDAPAGWFELGSIPPEDDSRGGGTGELGEKLLRAIGEVTDKPLTHVLLTHHHSDHIGGILPLLEAGAIPVGSAPALEAIRRFASRLPAGAVEVKGEWRHGGGEREMRAVRLPPDNPKAENFLVPYFPRLKLMYVTGFFYPVPKGEDPPPESLPLAAWFINWLDRSGLPVDTLYNLHGGELKQWQRDLHRGQSDLAPAPRLNGDASATNRKE